MRVHETVLDLLQEVQQAQLDKAGRVLNLQPREVEAMVRDADPTPKMKYGTWLLKQWLRAERGVYDRLDLYNIGTREHAQSVLAQHSRLVQLKRADEFGIAANIFAYSDLNELELALEDVPQASFLSRRQVKRGRADPLLVPGSQLIDTEGKHRLYAVTTPDAAMFHGRGTQWCTRAREAACHYASEDTPLFVIWHHWGLNPEDRSQVVQFTYDFSDVKDYENVEVGPGDIEADVDALMRKAAEAAGTWDQFEDWMKGPEGAEDDAWESWVNELYSDKLIEKFPNPDMQFEIKQLLDRGGLKGLFDTVSDRAGVYWEIVPGDQGHEAEIDVDEVVDATSWQDIRFAFDPRRREQAAQYQQQELPFRGTLPRESLRADVYRILVA